MVDFFFIKTLSGLKPSDSRTREKIKKFKKGEIIRVSGVKKPRNPGFHRKGMALLQVGFENQDRFAAFDEYFVYMKIRAGCVTPFKGPNGKTHLIIDSLAFDKMDNLKFEEVYHRFFVLVCEDLDQLVDCGELERAILEEARGFLDTEERAKVA